MVVYIASQANTELISSACKENEEVVVKAESSNEFELQKYVKQNAVQFGSVDKLILDLEACVDFEEEIIMSITDIKLLYDELRIIIVASNRQPGDELLTKIFNLGIKDIICSEDRVTVKSELKSCLIKEKTFREALIFKDAKKEKIVIKNEIKQTVEKVMIGISGAEAKIGVTHNSIVLANHLRTKGFMVALAEFKGNGDTAFEAIRKSFSEELELYEELYFTLNGVDYFPDCNDDKLSKILNRSYNFILIDFGEYRQTDRIILNKCAEKIVIAGAKPWQVEKLDYIFDERAGEDLEHMIFCFNFVNEDFRQEVKDSMSGFKTYFLDYCENSFESDCFGGADEFLEKYMPVRIEEEKEEKKVFFISRFRGKRKERRQKKKNEQN